MSAENDNKPLEEVKAPEAQAEQTTEVCGMQQGALDHDARASSYLEDEL